MIRQSLAVIFGLHGCRLSTTHGRDMTEHAKRRYGVGEHPNSLAAIAPHCWQPGESGNPAGRPPNYGNSWKEWLNELGRPDKHSVADIRAIAEAPDDSTEHAPAKRAAAVRLLESMDRGRDGRESTDIVLDRSIGKAPMQLQIQQQTEQIVRVVLHDEPARPELVGDAAGGEPETLEQRRERLLGELAALAAPALPPALATAD